MTDEELNALVTRLDDMSDLSRDHAAGLLDLGHKVAVHQAMTAITTLRAQLAEARTKAKDAISTLDAWFDRRALGHDAVDQACLDAASGYLRTSRSGGMPQEESDMVLAVFQDMARLGAFADLFARAVKTQAEAALAAQEVMHEDAPAAIIGEIGNQIHNLGCELQNDEDVSLRLSGLACRLWGAAKLFPTEPTALDRYREKVLREAANALPPCGFCGGSETILALIEGKP